MHHLDDLPKRPKQHISETEQACICTGVSRSLTSWWKLLMADMQQICPRMPAPRKDGVSVVRVRGWVGLMKALAAV